jgi:predicted nucleic acid-binding protein
MRKAVAVDAAFLDAFLNPRRRSEPVSNLIRTLSSENTKIVIPTPALAEVLTRRPDAAQDWTHDINRYACFQVRPFDDKASFELAQMSGGNAPGLRDILRFDRQIVAIAKVYGVSVLYSDDERVVTFAEECGIPAKRLKDLG